MGGKGGGGGGGKIIMLVAVLLVKVILKIELQDIFMEIETFWDIQKLVQKMEYRNEERKVFWK